MSLITHAGDREHRLVPQLRETAAWSACMSVDVFREVMRSEPGVLLRSDVATADVKDRAALVQALLNGHAGGKIVDRELGTYARYRKLNHPEIEKQLLPFIVDRANGEPVRGEAIDIAEACNVSSLQSLLADIALDRTEPLVIRASAAAAVGVVGDETTIRRLMPLARGQGGRDPHDELKGYVLRSLWPKAITAEELFPLLGQPKHTKSLGVYGVFLCNMSNDLKPGDLPLVLRWMRTRVPLHKLEFAFRELVKQIIPKAWRHLDTPGVLDELAELTVAGGKQHDGIFGKDADPKLAKELAADDAKRRLLLGSLVRRFSDPADDAASLITFSHSMVSASDIPWMLEHVRTAESETVQSAWAHLLWYVFGWNPKKHLEDLLQACEEVPVLRKVFSPLLTPIALDSPQAAKMREYHADQKKWREVGHRRRHLMPTPAERIRCSLALCESGKLEGWWHLNLDLSLEPGVIYSKNESEADLTELPGWESADMATKTRILAAARQYVTGRNAEASKWLVEGSYHRPACAGYRALRLLVKEDPPFIAGLDAASWARWAPIILGYPSVFSKPDDEAEHRRLVRAAYQNAPGEVVTTLLTLIDGENARKTSFFVIPSISDCWDDRLETALLGKAREQSTKPGCMARLVGTLLQQKSPAAKAFAESLVTAPPPAKGDARKRAVAAAGQLIGHCGDHGWNIVWPAFQQDAAFGKEVIVSCYSPGPQFDAFDALCEQMTPPRLEALYIWITRQFRRSECKGMVKREVSQPPRDPVEICRRSALNHLREHGTQDACEALRRIVREFPRIDLRWSIYRAELVTRQKTWIPLKPPQLLDLANNPDARLVDSGTQLIQVIMESLKSLQAKLHGETPAVIDLWNNPRRSSKTICTPKDEGTLSDYVKRHLEAELRVCGIVVNREVEIRRGQQTDIRVDAFRMKDKKRIDIVSVIVETKGCWNRDLRHAMKTQLVGRYLRDNRCQHGLYLVGCYHCESWDNRDRRRRPAHQRPALRKRFDAQARRLSKDGVDIRALVLDVGLRTS